MENTHQHTQETPSTVPADNSATPVPRQATEATEATAVETATPATPVETATPATPVVTAAEATPVETPPAPPLCLFTAAQVADIVRDAHEKGYRRGIEERIQNLVDNPTEWPLPDDPAPDETASFLATATTSVWDRE